MRAALCVVVCMCRVYMLPPGACGWVGSGHLGCDGSFECRAWINGNNWDVAQPMVHELGHNMFMGHAGSVNEDGWFDP